MKLLKQLKDYLVGAYAEMKKVTWPTKKQTINYSIAVAVLSLGMAIFFGVLDYGFSIGIAELIQLF